MCELLNQSNNKLLAILPEADYQQLLPHLETVNLTQGQILYNPNELIKDVYFPVNAVIFLVAILSNKAMTQVGLIGREGIIGLPVFLGNKYSRHLLIVSFPGVALRINSEVLTEKIQVSETLQKCLLCYTQCRLNQSMQLSVCHANHKIKQQLVRWLLLVHDGIEQDELAFTQQFIAQMLGVRRATITEALNSLEKEQMINCERGVITILNRLELEKIVCECYGVIKEEIN